jgi:hypothetical protein
VCVKLLLFLNVKDSLQLLYKENHDLVIKDNNNKVTLLCKKNKIKITFNSELVIKTNKKKEREEKETLLSTSLGTFFSEITCTLQFFHLRKTFR